MKTKPKGAGLGSVSPRRRPRRIITLSTVWVVHAVLARADSTGPTRDSHGSRVDRERSETVGSLCPLVLRTARHPPIPSAAGGEYSPQAPHLSTTAIAHHCLFRSAPPISSSLPPSCSSHLLCPARGASSKRRLLWTHCSPLRVALLFARPWPSPTRYTSPPPTLSPPLTLHPRPHSLSAACLPSPRARRHPSSLPPSAAS